MKKLLKSLGLIDTESLELVQEGTRDKPGINVLRCKRSGIIFLDEVGITDAHYREKKFHHFQNQTQTEEEEKKLSLKSRTDSVRRKDQFIDILRGRRLLDFGTGEGLLLDLLREDCLEVSGVELNERNQRKIKSRGLTCYESLRDIKNTRYDVISAFHVLEHLANPLGVLEEMRGLLSEKGKIIIEVPHARDFLISQLDLDSFKKFTFWSEHLILHTRNSLRVFLEASGFTNITISGFQRYNLANHLYWLRHERPGGHEYWPSLTNSTMDNAYSSMLSALDMNDTLIAVADK